MKSSLIRLIGYVFCLTSFSAPSWTIELKTPIKDLGKTTARTYQGNWKMLNKVGDDWVHVSNISEVLSERSDGKWQHQQKTVSVGQQASATEVTRTVQGHNYFTEKMVYQLLNANVLPANNSNQVKEITYIIGDKTASMKATLANEQSINRTFDSLPFNGYDGMILGLVISGIHLEEGKVFRLPVMMYGQGVTPYWVDAFVSAVDVVTINGQNKKLWQVDTQWLDVYSGIDSPKGPENSGGSYYIFQNPSPNQAAVYRYKNDTVDIVLDQ